MIDEKKLILHLNDWMLQESFLRHMTNPADTIAECIKAVEEQPKIGGWIPCSDRLPEEKINPVTKDFYEYQVTFKSEDVTDVRHYKFGKGHWWNGPGIMDEYVTAWREPLEAYHG